jgi:hypothetical protein
MLFLVATAAALACGEGDEGPPGPQGPSGVASRDDVYCKAGGPAQLAGPASYQLTVACDTTADVPL